MRISTSLLFIGFLLSVFHLNAQIETNELPNSFYNQSERPSDENYKVNLDKPELNQIIAQDILDDTRKDLPWRFGLLLNSNFNLNNSGEWISDDNGISIWKLKIVAQDAMSLNLNFDDFVLSSNAKLFLYNSSHTDVLGALTEKNNKENLQFSTRPISGDELTLELVVPTDEMNSNRISINEVVYGYRNVRTRVNKIFQSSSGCNINISCPDGDVWQEIKRSVVIITTSSNTRICTGTLINNVRQDSIPYLLTAGHCGVQNNAVFVFNYESPLCSPNVDSSLAHAISGASRKSIAVNQGSDFHLMQLSSTPPSSYNAFYAGWSAVNTPSTNSTCIHHPVGDVKKISMDLDPVTTSGYYSTGTTHWQIANWEKGTTQGGSSGAPLFDQSQRIIGQLHGGDAACGNRAQDYFGKFSISWDNNSDSTRQLKYWLDPDSTGITIIDGLDPIMATNNFDLQVINVGNISNYSCDTTLNPIISVRNVGNTDIDSFYVDYQLGSGTIQTVTQVSTLSRNMLNLVSLAPISVNTGVHSLNVNIRIAGPQNDQDTSNNKMSYSFQTTDNSDAVEVIVSIMTDSDGEETSWAIIDSTSSVVLAKGDGYPSMTGGALYVDTLCLFSACFSFNLYDSFGDGFNNGRGNGFALIKSMQNDTIFLENSFTSSFVTDSFCVQKVNTGILTIDQSNVGLSIYPNPIKAGETLKLNSKSSFEISLIEVNGRLVKTEFSNEISIPENLAQGMYFIKVVDRSSNKSLDIKKVLVY